VPPAGAPDPSAAPARQNADLASVRDPAALARLPREERAAWDRLWADVAALLERAGGKGPPQK
jgi:hypothetical protein